MSEDAIRNLQSMVDDLTSQQLVQQAFFMAIASAASDRAAIAQAFERHFEGALAIAQDAPWMLARMHATADQLRSAFQSAQPPSFRKQ